MGFGDFFKPVSDKERRRKLGYERCAMCNHSEMYHSVICQVCKCKRFAPSGRVGMNP